MGFSLGKTLQAVQDLVQDDLHGAITLSEATAKALELVESKKPGYTGGIMDAAARIQAAAELLSTVYPAEDVGKALEDLAAKAARETTDRAPAGPRLKLEKDALPDENPAVFAWRAYQTEAKAKTLHRGLIGQEDKALAVKLANWLRTHDMPEGIDIPTKPEWNTRQLKKLGITASGNDDPAISTALRLYAVARKRRYKRFRGHTLAVWDWLR